MMGRDPYRWLKTSQSSSTSDTSPRRPWPITAFRKHALWDKQWGKWSQDDDAITFLIRCNIVPRVLATCADVINYQKGPIPGSVGAPVAHHHSSRHRVQEDRPAGQGREGAGRRVRIITLAVDKGR
jgi:hypothetical protein